ncbi:MAG: hypothetical protein JWO38_599 [Gemmataceae bacterium]|nr:hypothetical protein [Gemmataceae bacterium]
MNPKKQKEKDRRRARKLAEQAWDAVNAGNLDLAEKIVRRAVAAQLDNPVLWVDQGVILGLRRKEAESADAFRAAISLAPTFAEPYARLAALRIRQGFTAEAVALQTQAVRHATHDAGYAEQLSAYQSLADSESPPAAPPPVPAASAPEPRTASPAADPVGDWPHRLAAFDWAQLGDRLTRDGCVVIDQLVDAANCDQLGGMFDRDELFAKTVVMDRPEFGQGEYRYFRAPIPAVVDQLRRAVYPHVARIANSWERLLGEPERFPPVWDDFREECRRAGQTAPTPILLRYGPGGFNALHRDLRGAVFFPIQMAVVLSRRADPEDPESSGFRGGEFLLCDVPERKKSRRRIIPAGLGDVVLFCTRDRLVRVGDVYGLQPVKHGAARITAGMRVVLGVPFHEYR